MIVVKIYCFKIYKAKRNRNLHKVTNIAGIIYNHCIPLHKKDYRLFKIILGKKLNPCNDIYIDLVRDEFNNYKTFIERIKHDER